MNAKYQTVLGSCLHKTLKMYTSLMGYPQQYQDAYKVLTTDIFEAYKYHGIIQSFALGENAEFTASVALVREKYPTVRGANPNVNVMTAVRAVFDDIINAHRVHMKGYDPQDSWSKLSERQAFMDFLRSQQGDFGLVKDFNVTLESLSVELKGADAYLSPKQLAKLAGVPKDLPSKGPGFN